MLPRSTDTINKLKKKLENSVFFGDFKLLQLKLLLN